MFTRFLRVLGTILLCSDMAVIVTLVVGVVLLVSGREQIFERFAAVLLGFFVISVAGRIVAGVHVLLADDLSPGARLDAFMRHVFVTGLSASRYLRSLDERE
jgi:hypothetical protein